MLEMIRKIGRDGKEVYICPLCGHLFVNNKKYSKHIIKSHIRNSVMNKRKMKKLYKRLIVVNVKEENKVPLEKYEKLLKLKAKFNNIKLE